MAVPLKTPFPKIWREYWGFIFSFYLPPKNPFLLKKNKKKERKIEKRELNFSSDIVKSSYYAFRDFISGKVNLKKLSSL